MKRLLVFLAVALMLLVASCGDGNTVSGYVVVKRHNPSFATASFKSGANS